ncbi:hypothetical protein B7494_g2745 [Chlorociboria aeruginascens]|nr:hypothetical protein B7494_g2745 [Chlorociboria aeruginascens]
MGESRAREAVEPDTAECMARMVRSGLFWRNRGTFRRTCVPRPLPDGPVRRPSRGRGLPLPFWYRTTTGGRGTGLSGPRLPSHLLSCAVIVALATSSPVSPVSRRTSLDWASSMPISNTTSTMGDVIPSFQSPFAWATVLVIAIVYGFLSVPKGKKASNMPVFPKPTAWESTLSEGYKKYPDKPFKVENGEHPVVIIPVKYLDQIKSLPEDQLSLDQEIYQRFLGRYTRLGAYNDGHIGITSVKIDLTRNISKTLEVLQDEMTYAADQNICGEPQWVTITLYTQLLRVVALLSGRVFVGMPLCRDEEWIAATINYTVDVFLTVLNLAKIPGWYRPLVAPLDPQYQALKKHMKNAARMVKPVIAKRLEDMKAPGFVKPADMIQWSIDNAAPFGKSADMEFQGGIQLSVSMAAIHTTTIHVTNVLYDLASRPEYIAPLREEISVILAEDNGTLLKTSMTKLRKLDSFMKESARLNPPSLLSIVRLVTSTITLPDGTILPPGTHVAVASSCINRDPAIWEDPEIFDGFRFEKLRSQPGSENRYQFVTTGADALNFGHGIHACPGRFFASNEIKVILCHLILNYDFRFPAGQEERPDSVSMGDTLRPDTTREMMFRKRVAA